MSKLIRRLPIAYRPSVVEATANGIGTNEIKTGLVKDGYDIHCPSCHEHFSSGGFSHKASCPKCGYSWRVGVNGHPLVGVK